ncbi:hypothetical protein HPB47_004597 [Ixodes persulcatus]|uniref:Uncharacterized protein n=1 Tax=Ixodes persulcatus TaxID=34615 RepID=A0AC60PFE6_IXOPE|nr:hypothetical protein HPB47_004597 [Ixodes persulcatus]
MVSRKAPQNKGGNAFAGMGQANELAEIKALLKQALAENKALREELNRLKEGTRERVEVVHAPEETISAESDGGESASPPLKRRALVMARPRREAREAKPVRGDQETFVTKNMLDSAITGCMERMLTALQSRASRLAHGTPNPFDAWAPELAHRAGEPLDPSLAFFLGGERLVTFRDILDHYTGERLRYPPAHPSLDKRTSVAWRRLQTDSFPSPSLLNKWYPDKYKPNCKLCGGHANLRHMVWECSRIDCKSHPLLEKIDNQESWETLLLCSDPSVQNQLVQLAEDAAKTQRVQAAV